MTAMLPGTVRLLPVSTTDARAADDDGMLPERGRNVLEWERPVWRQRLVWRTPAADTEMRGVRFLVTAPGEVFPSP